MRRIVAKTPIAPVLEEPRAAGTQATQLLYGHCAEVITTEGRWLRVRGADGYEGWTHEGYTAPCEDGGSVEWGWDADGELSMGCSIRDSTGATLDLPLGAVVGGGHLIAGRGADCSGMLQSIFALHGIHLLRDAWQQATQGVAVEGGIEGASSGDLLFFSDREDGHITHVAMVIGRSKAVHIALGRGGHYLESFDNPDDYATGLIGRFRFARRIVG